LCAAVVFLRDESGILIACGAVEVSMAMGRVERERELSRKSRLSGDQRTGMITARATAAEAEAASLPRGTQGLGLMVAMRSSMCVHVFFDAGKDRGAEGFDFVRGCVEVRLFGVRVEVAGLQVVAAVLLLGIEGGEAGVDVVAPGLPVDGRFGWDGFG
jgi:hypothetical protein